MPLVFSYAYGGKPPTSSQQNPAMFPDTSIIPNMFPNSEFDPTWTQKLAAAYENITPKTKPSTKDFPTYSNTHNAPLQFAPEPSDGSAPGSTTHPTLAILLGASTSTYDTNVIDAPTVTSPQVSGLSQAGLQSAGQPNFYPTIRGAKIRVHSAEVLTGHGFDDKVNGDDPALMRQPTQAASNFHISRPMCSTARLRTELPPRAMSSLVSSLGGTRHRSIRGTST